MNAAKWWIAAGVALVALAPAAQASHTLANEKIRLVVSELGALESVDLRYPNGYALRVRGVTTVTEDEPTNPQNTR